MAIFEDNQSAICVAKNQQTSGQMKHIDIRYHFVRELVEAGRIKLVYCSTEQIIADMLTKGLAIQQFKKLRQLARVVKGTHID